MLRKLAVILYEEIEGAVSIHGTVAALPESVGQVHCLFFQEILLLVFRKILVRLLALALVADSAYSCNLLCGGLLRPPLNTRNYHFHIVSYLMFIYQKSDGFF